MVIAGGLHHQNVPPVLDIGFDACDGLQDAGVPITIVVVRVTSAPSPSLWIYRKAVPVPSPPAVIYSPHAGRWRIKHIQDDIFFIRKDLGALTAAASKTEMGRD